MRIITGVSNSGHEFPLCTAEYKF